MTTLHTWRTLSLFAVIGVLLVVTIILLQRVFAIPSRSSAFSYMLGGGLGGGAMVYGMFFNLLKQGKLQWFVRQREAKDL